MPDEQLSGTHQALTRSGSAGLRPHALTACAATAAVASLVACSSTGTLDGTRTPPARGSAPAAVLAAPPPEKPGATLARALGPVLRDGDPRLAVAVLDLDGANREIASYRGDAMFDTASIIKVDILAALLLQAQDEGRELTAEEREAAEAMIRTSDNDAANRLWRAIGRGEGLDAANERLGLSSTQAGPGFHWGLTRTTAKDQIRLLRSVFARVPAVSVRARAGLNRASRAYIRELMGGIVEGQDWGVSAAAPRWALKNGWLQRTATQLWVINSIGQVTVHGRRYLVSVLSSGNASMEDGVSLVERAVRAAIGAASAHARPWPE
ncbi:serine hydrolase [Streptomyces sp. NPDC051041]|uniref:serine hydrolase n=1 Tax=Streptomyces sp. NPDC051041 TaxID=3365640 RepID=UPI0037B6DDBB